jgi:hypothetical protein
MGIRLLSDELSQLAMISAKNLEVEMLQVHLSTRCLKAVNPNL